MDMSATSVPDIVSTLVVKTTSCIQSMSQSTEEVAIHRQISEFKTSFRTHQIGLIENLPVELLRLLLLEINLNLS